MLKRMLATFVKQDLRPLPLQIILENTKIKEIKIFPELIGKDIKEVSKFNFNNIYYVNRWHFEDVVKKEINKNIHLL